MEETNMAKKISEQITEEEKFQRIFKREKIEIVNGYEERKLPPKYPEPLCSHGCRTSTWSSGSQKYAACCQPLHSWQTGNLFITGMNPKASELGTPSTEQSWAGPWEVRKSLLSPRHLPSALLQTLLWPLPKGLQADSAQEKRL